MPYGSDYRIRPRPIWGPNEPTFGESMTRGIGQFLKNRADKQQEGDEWENQVRDAGGEVIEPPSTMDRLRGIGNTIRKHLPGYDPLPEAEANMGTRRPGDMVRSTPDRGFTRSPEDGGDQGFDIHTTGTPTGGGNTPSLVTRTTTSPSFGHGHRGPVDDATPSTHWGISDEIDRSIQTGPGGRSAIMPTALGRSQMATRAQMAAEARARAGKRADFGYEKGIEHQNKMEEIQATPRSSATDPAEWDRRQAIIAENARKLKGTPSAATPGTGLAEKRLRAQTLRSSISAAQAIIPKNPFDRRQAMRDPAQAARITEAERQVDAGTKELNELALPEDKPIATPDANAGEREHNAGAPVEVMKQRAAVVKADALKKYPKASKEAVAAYVRNVMKREGWNVQ